MAIAARGATDKSRLAVGNVLDRFRWRLGAGTQNETE
jgi:hypothetical protein